MDNPRTIFLSPPEEVPERLFGRFAALPGRFAVAMYRAESRNGLYMPESGRLGADVGVVISDDSPVIPGAEVLVRPEAGMWLEDFMGSGMTVKLLGVSEPWYESIPAMRQGDFLIPLYDWVLLERKAVSSTLATFQKWQKWEARVIGVGPDVKSLVVEKNVVFKQPSDHFTVKWGDEAWLLVREENLLAVIDES